MIEGRRRKRRGKKKKKKQQKEEGIQKKEEGSRVWRGGRRSCHKAALFTEVLICFRHFAKCLYDMHDVI